MDLGARGGRRPDHTDRAALQFPSGDLRTLRLDPLDTDGVVTFSEVRIVAKDGRVVREIAPVSGKSGSRWTCCASTADNWSSPFRCARATPNFGSISIRRCRLTLTTLERVEAFLNRWLAVLAGFAIVFFALDRLPPRARAEISAARAWIGATPGSLAGFDCPRRGRGERLSPSCFWAKS